MSVRENDLYMQLTLLTEYESLMFWQREAGRRQTMVSCELDEVTEVSEEWAGMVLEMKTALKENAAGLSERLDHLETKAKEDMSERKQEIKMLGKDVKGVKDQLAAVDAKLEAVLGLLSSRS